MISQQVISSATAALRDDASSRFLLNIPVQRLKRRITLIDDLGARSPTYGETPVSCSPMMAYIRRPLQSAPAQILEGINMLGHRVLAMCLLAFFGLFFSFLNHVTPTKADQAAQPPEKPGQHHHHHQYGQMDMNIPSGATDKCEPGFTYDDGPLAPSHWQGVCNAGRMQAPIDITKSEKVSIPPLPPLEMKYQPADLDMVNDCNHYLIKLRFPPNQWLKYNRKPYRLSEITFHEPGEIAVNGKRPPMSLQLVHLAPEATFLII